MSKNLVKLVRIFPKTFEHGIYNVRFMDGIDFPFNVGKERWRVVEGQGYASFDNNSANPVNKISFDLINHPLSSTKEIAKINLTLNGKELLQKPVTLKIAERKRVEVAIDGALVKAVGNNLVISVDYGKSVVRQDNTQILGIISMTINNVGINLESIDSPYVSSLGPKMAGVVYNNWGGTNKDLWRQWEIHTQMFERLPDFWWVRNLYYWDIPKKFILGPFLIIIAAVGVLAVKLYKLLF
jgi:hypothetical protein